MFSIKRLITMALALAIGFGHVSLHADSVNVGQNSAAEKKKMSKDELSQMLKAGTDFFDLNQKAGSPLSEADAKDSKKLRGLKNGDKVAIYSLWLGKYMQLSSGLGDATKKYLTATGDHKTDPGCQFIVVRDSSNWITFKNAETGFNLQANAADKKNHVARFENANFLDWERWSLEESSVYDKVVRLQNKATGGYFFTGLSQFINGLAATNNGENSVAPGGRHCVMLIQHVDPKPDKNGTVAVQASAAQSPAVAATKSAEEQDSEVAGFMDTHGVARRISVGLAKDVKGNLKPLVVVVAADNSLWEMDSSTMNAWSPVSVMVDGIPFKSFRDVAVSDTGTVCAVSEDNDVVVISADGGQTWKSLGIPMDGTSPAKVDRIAIESDSLIACLDKTSGRIFFYHDGKWEVQPAKARTISAGGGMILAVNQADTGTFMYDGNGGWTAFQNPYNIRYFAIQNKDMMWGTAEKDGHFYLYEYKNGTWSPMMDTQGQQIHGFRHIATNMVGTLVLQKRNGRVMLKGDLNTIAAAAKAAPAEVKAAAAAAPAAVVAGAETPVKDHPVVKAGAKKTVSRAGRTTRVTKTKTRKVVKKDGKHVTRKVKTTKRVVKPKAPARRPAVHHSAAEHPAA